MIRKMKETDLKQVLEIETLCFHDFWNESQYLYELKENPYSMLWVIEEEGKVIGFYDLWIIFERGEIANIAVHPQYQGRGYGHQLMDHLLQKARENECEVVSLEVRVSNSQAIRLYEEYDFSIINTKPGYYKSEQGYEDAYFMMKGM